MLKPVIVNVVGLVVIALGQYGIDVSPETQAEIVGGLAAIGCVINLWLQRKPRN